MKTHYLTFLLLVAAIIVNSQTINTTIKTQHNYRFNLLEKNRVPHKILSDYGYEFINISKYDGILRSGNYMSIARYNELYNTIVSSIVVPNVSGVYDPALEKEQWRNLQKQANESNYTTSVAKVILSGLSYNYNSFNPNALSQNKITINNGRYDDKYIRGSWQNPYLSNYTFGVVAPFKKISKASVQVQLPTNLWHTNNLVYALEVNFGTKGSTYQNIKNGAIAAHTYTKPGTYIWTYRISIDGGRSYKYSRQKVQVKFEPKGRINPMCPVGNEFNPLIVPIVAATPFQGEFGAATLEVVYGSNSCQIENPLIVVEGLDTGLMGEAGDIGDSDLDDFLTSVRFSGSDDLRDLVTTNGATDMDIIYVNWDNGVDFLERNALVLEEVINWVNDNKVTTTENVVLGQSMGGVIARYALRTMEDNGDDHDTRLYISHDAPHQGAHVPLGASFMARHLLNQFIETPLGGISIPLENSELGLLDIGELLNAPAVNQLLSNTVNEQLQLDNTIFNTWQNELASTGYPQLTRNVALSNGSHCAESQGFTSNQTLLDVTGEGATSVVTDVLLLSGVLGTIPGILFADLNTTFLGVLPGNARLNLDFNVKAFSSSGSARIYDGSIKY